TRYVLRLDPGLGKENLQPIVREDAVELGYRYSSGAIEAEADDDGLSWEDPHAPTARPGTRAPHLELERDGSSVSSLDLFGRDFVLLAGGEGARRLRRGVPGRRRFRLGPVRRALRRRLGGRRARAPGRLRRVARPRGSGRRCRRAPARSASLDGGDGPRELRGEVLDRPLRARHLALQPR